MTEQEQHYLQRVRLERDALSDNITKLNTFLTITAERDIDPEQLPLLHIQIDAMKAYRGILDRRIKLLLDK